MLNDHCHRVSTHLQSINIIIIILLKNTVHDLLQYRCRYSLLVDMRR